MRIGVVGLGKMGSRIAKKLYGEHDVIVWNRSKEPINELKSYVKALKTATSIKNLVQALKKPRVIWSMVPSGKPTDEVLSEVSKYIQKDDIVIDGGNANYRDTEKRYQKFKKNGIKFLGIGVSGGVLGEERGFSLMVGGDKSVYDYVEPLLKTLSKPSGIYEYLGQGGAGHFAKMVHNGIEYGMMQSLAEGFDVLKNSKYKLDLSKVAKVYSRGAVVSGLLVDLAKDFLEKNPELSGISGVIPRGGEGDWTVAAAKEEKVPVDLIERSVEFRRKSEKDAKIQNSFTAKMINALRNAFGGHEIKKK